MQLQSHNIIASYTIPILLIYIARDNSEYSLNTQHHKIKWGINDSSLPGPALTTPHMQIELQDFGPSREGGKYRTVIIVQYFAYCHVSLGWLSL